jgi:hypothetical protein
MKAAQVTANQEKVKQLQKLAQATRKYGDLVKAVQ